LHYFPPSAFSLKAGISAFRQTRARVHETCSVSEKERRMFDLERNAINPTAAMHSQESNESDLFDELAL
jgi:hypothetical protein